MSERHLTFENLGSGAPELLAALHKSSFARPWSAGDFTELLTLPGTESLVATTSDKEPAGMILFRHAAGEGEILTLAVRPDMRRSGIATALVAETVQRLRSIVVSVFLEVAPSNRAARALYHSAGFVEVGRRPAYYGSGGESEDALIMRAELSRTGELPIA